MSGRTCLVCERDSEPWELVGYGPDPKYVCEEDAGRAAITLNAILGIQGSWNMREGLLLDWTDVFDVLGRVLQAPARLTVELTSERSLVERPGFDPLVVRAAIARNKEE